MSKRSTPRAALNASAFRSLGSGSTIGASSSTSRTWPIIGQTHILADPGACRWSSNSHTLKTRLEESKMSISLKAARQAGVPLVAIETTDATQTQSSILKELNGKLDTL